MRFRYLLLIILPLLIVLGSCGKKCNDEKQVNIDDSIILKFLSDKGITAQKHASGVYYQILNPGSGSIVYSANTTQPVSFKLGGVITGWQVGIPLIQKGGKIRLFIPSGFAYGCEGQGPIPANAVLDFDIELIDATN